MAAFSDARPQGWLMLAVLPLLLTLGLPGRARAEGGTGAGATGSPSVFEDWSGPDAQERISHLDATITAALALHPSAANLKRLHVRLVDARRRYRDSHAYLTQPFLVLRRAGQKDIVCDLEDGRAVLADMIRLNEVDCCEARCICYRLGSYERCVKYQRGIRAGSQCCLDQIHRAWSLKIDPMDDADEQAVGDALVKLADSIEFELEEVCPWSGVRERCPAECRDIQVN